MCRLCLCQDDIHVHVHVEIFKMKRCYPNFIPNYFIKYFHETFLHTGMVAFLTLSLHCSGSFKLIIDAINTVSIDVVSVLRTLLLQLNDVNVLYTVV